MYIVYYFVYYIIYIIYKYKWLHICRENDAVSAI